jgi:hypothetical protein
VPLGLPVAFFLAYYVRVWVLCLFLVEMRKKVLTQDAYVIAKRVKDPIAKRGITNHFGHIGPNNTT